MSRPLLCALLMIALTGTASASRTHGGPAPGGGSALIDGIAISFVSLQPAYPRNSLARVLVRVTNTRSTPVYLSDVNSCREENPRVQSIDAAGSPLYPPALQPLIPMPCPPLVGGRFPPPAFTIPPDTSITRPSYVIVRSSRLQPAVTLYGIRPNRNVTVMGQPVIVGLTRGRTLQVALAAGTAPSLTIAPSAGGSGPSYPIMYASVAVTSGRDGAPVYCPQIQVLQPLSGTTVTPGCRHPTLWHAIVGRVGWVVADVLYRPKRRQ